MEFGQKWTTYRTKQTSKPSQCVKLQVTYECFKGFLAWSLSILHLCCPLFRNNKTALYFYCGFSLKMRPLISGRLLRARPDAHAASSSNGSFKIDMCSTPVLAVMFTSKKCTYRIGHKINSYVWVILHLCTSVHQSSS